MLNLFQGRMILRCWNKFSMTKTLLFITINKVFYRPVPSFFGFRRKKTARKFISAAMISYTFAANTFFWACISASAVLSIFCSFAFHYYFLHLFLSVILSEAKNPCNRQIINFHSNRFFGLKPSEWQSELIRDILKKFTNRTIQKVTKLFNSVKTYHISFLIIKLR